MIGMFMMRKAKGQYIKSKDRNKDKLQHQVININDSKLNELGLKYVWVLC